MRATIKDVSDMAGVSMKTVSRVLNKEKYVSEETRLRVEQAVAQLNFQPSVAARILAGKRSHQIALIYDNHSPHTSTRSRPASGPGALRKAYASWPNPPTWAPLSWPGRSAA